MSYSYAGNTNQLQAVTDASINPQGFNDGNTNGADYSYDFNGNMNLDNNKQIQSITYNHLNLPTKITFATTGTIEYLYNAIGQKVSKKVFDTGTNLTTITDYLSNYQYKNNVLQFFSTAEGYVNFTASLQKGGTDSYNYVFNYTDHLGNIRLSYSQDPSTNVLKIIEENHYYPFGLKHSGYNAEQLVYAKNSSDVLRLRPVPPLFVSSYNIKFQNQKREEELGLNWDSFKWRNYDYAIGRFMSIDPLSEKYVYNGTYNFSENRVIDGRELEGLEVVLLKDSEHNKPIINAAYNGSYADNPFTKTIHVFAHGNPSAFYNDNVSLEEKKADLGTINSGSSLNNALNSSELWKNSDSKEGFTIVLHSCRTGKTTTDKDGNKIESVAEKISGSDEMKGVKIIAPDQRDGFTAGGKELGPQVTKNTYKNGNYLPGTPKSEEGKQTATYGNWNTFQNGQQTNQQPGNTKPEEPVKKF